MKEEEIDNEVKSQSGSTDDDLKIKFDELLKERDELKDKLLRQVAESENTRKRSAKFMQEARDYAIFDFVKDIIPAMDNISRSIDHIDKIEKIDKVFAEGIRIVKRDLDTALENNQVEVIKPSSGDKFNYNLHNAISQIEVEDQKEGCVVSVMEIGYKIKDRLIRSAAVSVAK